MTLTLYVCVALPVFKHVNMTAPLRSGERGNVLSVGTYCCVAVQARSARRREALRSPQREERGGGILWLPPAQLVYSDVVYKAVQRWVAMADLSDKVVIPCLGVIVCTLIYCLIIMPRP